jgi:hypothetical protein
VKWALRPGAIENHSIRSRPIASAAALLDLQEAAEPGAPVRLGHAQHMRPLQRPAVPEPGNRVGEPDELVLVVRAEQDAAAVDRDDEDRHGDDVLLVGVPPDPALERDDLPEFLDGLQLANLHDASSLDVVPVTEAPAGREGS